MLKKVLYPKVEKTLNAIAEKLKSKHITPTQLTFFGLGLALITGWIYATGNFILGGIFLILSGASDLLDGPLARISGRASKFGAFFDFTIDRYSDFLIYSGLAFFFA
ncbi:MAG: CDP-alcohol phosphatidyltransferase family protein, partial [Candidatus Omnitrophica bacterium]|nr:CDP-alcohol phosphatidyltransferase family protein [Candidatus Omnitrophota bacterium]